MTKITEHSSTINITLPQKDVHAKMPVFYNPIMKSNRNISVLLLNSLDKENMNVALPLAGSGIRGLRFLKELDKGKMSHLFVNDKKENFVKVFGDNLKLNKISKKNITLSNEDASLFLVNQINSKKKPENFCGYFDYIDIDPFGSPNGFIDAAVSRLPRDGILAITATDTAALSGTYPKVTQRKYWSQSLRNYMMHETGLRILIRKMQLHGLPFDKALVPILAYHNNHYFRVYFRYSKGKKKCDAIIKNHQFLLFNSKTLEFKTSNNNTHKGFNQFAGPLWVGKLRDEKLVKKMAKDNPFPKEQKFLDLLNQEKDILGFYDLHALCKKHGKGTMKKDIALKKLDGTDTQFSDTGLKTTKSLKEVLMAFK